MTGGPPLQLTQDPLRDAALLLSLSVLLGGLVLLAARIAAAFRGREASRSLVVYRMLAVLGGLGGFIAYLRDPPNLGARWDLLWGGFSAAPWAVAVVLEAIRGRARRGAGNAFPRRQR